MGQATSQRASRVGRRLGGRGCHHPIYAIRSMDLLRAAEHLCAAVVHPTRLRALLQARRGLVDRAHNHSLAQGARGTSERERTSGHHAPARTTPTTQVPQSQGQGRQHQALRPQAPSRPVLVCVYARSSPSLTCEYNSI